MMPPAARRQPHDEGSAIVEFLALGVLLLVPLVYLVAVLGRLQAASFAVEGAARDGARAVAAAPERRSLRAVEAITELALLDQGFSQVPAKTTVRCDPNCATPEAQVSVTVSLNLPLPGIPLGLDRVLPTRVPVTAEAHNRVDRFS